MNTKEIQEEINNQDTINNINKLIDKTSVTSDGIKGLLYGYNA